MEVDFNEQWLVGELYPMEYDDLERSGGASEETWMAEDYDDSDEFDDYDDFDDYDRTVVSFLESVG